MATPDNCILVPVDGSVMDERTIDLATLLAHKYRATVTAIHIVEVPQRLPLEAALVEACAQGEAILQAALRYADHYGYDIETELLQARSVGQAIVDEALARGACLIVIGALLRPHNGVELAGAETALYVLQHAPCEVLIDRHRHRG